MPGDAATRAWIAARLLPILRDEPDASIHVGEFVLRPAQRRALGAVRRAIAEYGGVLIADPPGTGKTVLALAMAHELLRDGEHALVVAPAALRAQWDAAAARAHVAVRFVSVESLSRGARPAHAPVLVVDEAHHVRTPGTRRHQRVASLCLDARVLLLSATPVVNRRADRDALLSLFLGARAERLDETLAGRCVVRQQETALRPPVRKLGVIGAGVDVPGIAESIAALPPPLPVAEGASATALIAMTLAMAWRSSLAALDAALRRRVQRGEAMADLLRAGRAPTHAALRDWVIDDDTTQLALAALFDAPAVGGEAVAGALAALRHHLDAVRSLRALVRPSIAADAAARAEAIRALSASHPGTRTVVFARHAESIRALHRALRGTPGVVAVVGSRVLVAAGRWSRDEVLRALGPRARPLRDDDAKGIRIVLATDVLAEGVEMQGVGIVVHADVPWTPARLEQRLGRVTRVGSEQREVLEGRLAAPRDSRALIALGARLARKADARRASVREASARSALVCLLDRWSAGATDASPGEIRTIAVPSRKSAFVATLGGAGERAIIAGELRDGRWSVGASPRSLLRLLRPLDSACACEACAADATLVRDVQGVVERATARRRARELLYSDPGPAGRAAPDPRTAARIARVRARLARLLAHAPALARDAIAARLAPLIATMERPMEAAREHRLDELLRLDLDDSTFARRLGALLSGRTGTNEKSRPGVPGRFESLLVISPCGRQREATPRLAPPSASPGTAAPR